MAGGGFTKVGLVLLVGVPFLIWYFLGLLPTSADVGLVLFVSASVAGVVGFILIVYGEAVRYTARSSQFEGKECANCGTRNRLGASVCISCGVQFPAG
jgi:hypothetical protein